MPPDHDKAAQGSEGVYDDADLDGSEDQDDDSAPEPDGDPSTSAKSFDELLARRRRKKADDAADADLEVLIETDLENRAAAPGPLTGVVGIRGRREFTCRRRHLVKARSQLPDPQRGLCRDCA